MSRLIIFMCLVAYIQADVKHLTDRNLDLFKYDPSDVFSLPEDIDEEKPAVYFSGDVMKARVEKLENLNGKGKFKLDLKTQNGIQVTSVGKLKDDKTFVVSGSYSFTGVDGKRYRTRYTADEFGYHPITELELDIPEPQPLPAASENFALSDDRNLLGGNRNRFQFLNQNLNLDINRRGSGQSGDDYSYSNPDDYSASVSAPEAASQYEDHSDSGYDYVPPAEIFVDAPSIPSRQYLPVQ